MSAITRSRHYAGKLHESQFSSYHQIFVSPGCEVRSQLVSVFAREGLNMVVVAVLLAALASVGLVLVIAVCCRRKVELETNLRKVV